MDLLESALITNRELRERHRQIFMWMLNLTQGCVSNAEIKNKLKGKAVSEDIDILLNNCFHPKRRNRIRAWSVIYRLYGVSNEMVANFLFVYRRTVKKYFKIFQAQGAARLFDFRQRRVRKCENADYKQAVFETLHSPPSTHGFNRTTWRRRDIREVMARIGLKLGRNNIDRIIKNEGYRFVKARRVLTSNDPEFREKTDRIRSILSRLRKCDRFFSIDEFGPVAIKQHGGRRLVRANEKPTVPQFQHSKGSIIVTAALELSSNQLTHFYSKKKDTDEMITLLHVLIHKYQACKKLYFSWDAAGWHASKRFMAEVSHVNSRTFRREHKTPLVELAPLPARAQFLNVIESVFSGLATSVIHNSDYPSVAAAKRAIDRYFKERNAHFLKNPRRAGNWIWGDELVPAKFKTGQNCKHPRFR